MTQKLRTNYKAGMLAEFWARLYLRCKCYRILKSRWRTPVGEIDLLATRGRNLVIVEVKYRRKLDDALNCLHTQQQQRLNRAMRYAVASLPYYAGYTWRYDLLAMAPRRWPRHIVSAWESQ